MQALNAIANDSRHTRSKAPEKNQHNTTTTPKRSTSNKQHVLFAAGSPDAVKCIDLARWDRAAADGTGNKKKKKRLESIGKSFRKRLAVVLCDCPDYVSEIPASSWRRSNLTDEFFEIREPCVVIDRKTNHILAIFLTDALTDIKFWREAHNLKAVYEIMKAYMPNCNLREGLHMLGLRHNRYNACKQAGAKKIDFGPYTIPSDKRADELWADKNALELIDRTAELLYATEADVAPVMADQRRRLAEEAGIPGMIPGVTDVSTNPAMAFAISSEYGVAKGSTKLHTDGEVISNVPEECRGATLENIGWYCERSDRSATFVVGGNAKVMFDLSVAKGTSVLVQGFVPHGTTRLATDKNAGTVRFGAVILNKPLNAVARQSLAELNRVAKLPGREQNPFKPSYVHKEVTTKKRTRVAQAADGATAFPLNKKKKVVATAAAPTAKRTTRSESGCNNKRVRMEKQKQQKQPKLFHVESFAGRRRNANDNVDEFLVKWSGFARKSWEPATILKMDISRDAYRRLVRACP